MHLNDDLIMASQTFDAKLIAEKKCTLTFM